jgi:Predicted transcriptional regulators
LLLFFSQSSLDIICKASYTINAKYALLIERVRIIDNRIKELRKTHKLSQEELALAVGTTRQTITSIEIGKYTASLPLAYRIAKHFDLTIEEVFIFKEVDND